jgi:hypothetical protein
MLVLSWAICCCAACGGSRGSCPANADCIDAFAENIDAGSDLCTDGDFMLSGAPDAGSCEATCRSEAQQRGEVYTSCGVSTIDDDGGLETTFLCHVAPTCNL